MPCGHRRPFWYSFVRAKEYIFGGDAFYKRCRTSNTRIRSAQETQKSHRFCISASTMASCWSGRRGSNSLPPPWQGGALPDELRPQTDNAARYRGPAKICEAKVCGEKEKVWRLSLRSCPQDCLISRRTFDVVPPIGIEPMTRGFSVPCSTD